MSVRGLNWQSWAMKFIAGMNQKTDPRSLEPPELTIAKDCQADKVGGLQTRYPYGAIQDDIFGGGTLADCRRIEPNGTELVLFTDDTVYSWNSQQSKWGSRGTHLAAAVDQTPVFQSTEEQIQCDRAELSGTIVTAWVVASPGAFRAYVAARDAATGAITMSATALAASTVQPRLVALETKILLFFESGSDLKVYALDPADPSAALAGAATTVLATNYGGAYDVVECPGLDKAIVVATRTGGADYEVAFVTAGLTVTSSTKVRSCTGAVGIAWESTTPRAVVLRIATADIKADLLSSTLADGTVNTAIATAVGTMLNITAAWKSATTAAIFWDEQGASYATVFRNTITTSAVVGSTTSTLHAALASRAFEHGDSAFAWYATDSTSSATDATGAAIFTAALENVYLLYRDDGYPYAKACYSRAGGKPGTGYLPGVAETDDNTYAWCGTEMRLISTEAYFPMSYADRNPVDIVVEFDTKRARRCARSGNTLYVASGLGLLQYDGIGLTEVGFLQYPFSLTLADGGAGSMAAGAYFYKSTLRWQNGAGEADRSTTATVKGITQAINLEVDVTVNHLDHTLKQGARPDIAIEIWRTVAAAPSDAPYYRVTGNDPSATTGDNAYVENTPGTATTVLSDSFTDAVLTTKESHYENGDVLENLAPPPCQLVVATDTRVFVGGIAGDPDRVWYSKHREPGEVAAFHDALAVQIPAVGGAITGLALLFGRIPVVFRERAAYRLDGEGIGNTGQGFNYQVERIQGDCGAINQESIAVTEKGIIFKSAKGWYVTNGQSMEYVGGPVDDYDDETALATTVIDAQHQVRILSAERMLVFDTLISQWYEWTVVAGVHACMHDGQHVYLTSTGTKRQLTEYTDVDYGMDVEVAFLKLNEIHGYGAIDYFDVVGEFRSDCQVRVRLARDYWKDGANTYFQDKSMTVSATAGMPLQFRHRPSIKQVTALKVRLTVFPTDGGESIRLTGLAFMLGVQHGLNRNLATASKQ